MVASAETTKWNAATLGPRQLKAFKDALGRFGWAAKEEGEITDYSDGKPSFHISMLGPWVNPKATEFMEALKAKYGCEANPANYQAIVAELQSLTLAMKEFRPVKDLRRTPEEKAELNRAHEEREEKAAIEAARISMMTTHEYTRPEVAAAAKLVLGALWPATKFSVRSESYSGGGAVRASWVDGPRDQDVKRVMDIFQDTHFDGMDDSTHRSGPEEWNGHRFVFHTGYTSIAREYTAAFLRSVIDRFVLETTGAHDGADWPKVPTLRTDSTHPWVEREGGPCGYSFHTHDSERPEGVLCTDSSANFTAGDIVNQMAHHTSVEAPTQPIGARWDDGVIVRETVFKILLGDIKPAGLSVRPHESAGGVTVSQNEEKDGIEIRFPGKPAVSVLDDLKARGWRWSRFSKCWYAKRSPAALAFAEGLANA